MRAAGTLWTMSPIPGMRTGRALIAEARELAMRTAVTLEAGQAMLAVLAAVALRAVLGHTPVRASCRAG